MGALLARWLEDPGARALTLGTSGSTGDPKPVALSRTAMLASAMASLDRIGGPGQWLLALPPHRVAGLQVLVRSVLSGTTAVVLDDYSDLPAATAALGHEQPGRPATRRRYLAIVPTQLYRWLAEPAAAEALATYDAVLVGGGPVDRALLSRARDRSVNLVTTYGMTETCGGCVYDGEPLDGVAASLGPDGRVRLGGDVLFDGYVGRPDLTEAALRDGWFVTEDIGRLDGDGRLEVLGRADDVAVSGGVNVPLAAVQRRLAAMPGLEEVAVVAIPDPAWGQRVLAVATLTDGAAEPDLATVRDFVAAEHPRTWAPRELVVRDALPLLDSGKVDRIALRAGLVART